MTASLRASADGTQAIIGVGGVDKFKIGSDTLVVTPTGGLGYGTGSGGSVIQATSKSTAVTLNTPTGQITMSNAALTAGAIVTFTLNNALISYYDQVLVCVQGVGATANYRVWAGAQGAGNCTIAVKNESGGSLSEAIVLTVTIIKGAVA